LQEQIREGHMFVGILITVCRVSDNTPKLLSVDDTTIINKEPKVFISLVSTRVLYSFQVGKRSHFRQRHGLQSIASFDFIFL
jgi:hypothetical protein